MEKTVASKRDRKSVVQGKSVDLGGRRIIKKKKKEKKRKEKKRKEKKRKEKTKNTHTTRVETSVKRTDNNTPNRL